MLHIISQSLFKSCSAKIGLPFVAQSDAVLLVGDGVYNALHPQLLAVEHIFSIDEDCITRGLSKLKHIQYVNYAEMVTLTELHNPIVTWR